jgi:enoyl-CoA hydratase/carnithine racemase
VPADQLMTAAEEMARTIAKRGPLAVAAAIEAVKSGSEMPFDEGQTLEATLFGLLASTADMKEGMRAFLEKRAAEFTGR